MYADPLTITTDAVIDKATPAGEPIPFSTVSILGSKTKRVIPITYTPGVGADLAEQLKAANLTLTIGNEESGKGDGTSVRSVVKFEAWPVDSAGKKRYVATHMVLSVPKNVPMSPDDPVRMVISGMLLFARNFQTEANLAKFLNREV